ncbi:G-type lectin S-receptor-like serine/threonine-protein kinase [Apostasia shenzhenica]|uniref:Receptor-like serine/threonine-protein kinase n=1 Tax=Apostasia shenzhenica TaxID=1088818 RepID=A0A2H9ZX95_9ASPA|nr:G-type lectin S-receptor-like serine/threonine-protein kinase [Apostasia shenzhenica]
MAANSRGPCYFASIMLLIFFLNTNLSLASSDSLSLGQSLSGNQTLISKDATFALGFFSPRDSGKFYIGIWYNELPGQTVIWVANRASPVSDPATSKLQISDHGDLVLLNSSGTPIWSTEPTPKASIAILLETGNLVVRNDSNSDVNLWQSFAHPTDTWMPGGWLGVNKITGEYQSLTSWKNPEDPAPGLFGESMDPDGSNQYVLLWNGSQIYWTSGLWTGSYFSNVPGTRESTVFDFNFIDNKQRKFANYTINDKSIITRFVVDSEGQGLQWYWLSSTQQWQTEFTQPLNHCDVYSLCGPFGICGAQSTESVCTCVEGFVPTSEKEWALNDWSSGCSRKSQLRCGSHDNEQGKEDGFLEMPNVGLPANPMSRNVSGDSYCREACLKNCSCSAYAFAGGGCSIWVGELRNLRQVYDDGGGNLYLRLAASDIPSSSNSHKKIIAVVLGSAAGVVVILLICFSLLLAYRRKKRAKALLKIETSLTQFSYGDLQRITKNFSEKLGSGGFGSVFKGRLANSAQVAVKTLEGVRQGEKQFRAEVSTLGAIQHVNLVKLHGFCSEGQNRRLLVYEHMPNGSLNSHLFHDSSSELDWRQRFQIILGIARGLAYLHEECRECIVHCDMKPDNVLLDADFNPKISDFGMAKLIGRDFSRVLTTMRGTIGYLAPEWISGQPITPKVDVYSFGMTVFEAVSGRRNTGNSADGDAAFYPSWAAKGVIEGRAMSLLDHRLEGAADLEQLTRVCRVACWCIQDMEDHRPAMGQVVQVLEGILDVSMPPFPASLENMMGNQQPSSMSHGEKNENEATTASVS